MKPVCQTMPKKQRNLPIKYSQYVFRLVFTDKRTQDVFKMFCVQITSGRQEKYLA